MHVSEITLNKLSFPNGSGGKEPTYTQETQEARVRSLGREGPRKRKWQPLQCSCLDTPMDRGCWWATVHQVAKSQTGPSTKEAEVYTQV